MSLHTLSRRRFLHTSAVLATAAAVPRRLLAAEEAELIVRQAEPYNAEPALAHLAADAVTPLKYFYVRSHGATPQVQEADLQLTVEGLVNRPLKLSLAELKERFKPQSTAATLTCAGNRRLEMNRVKPVPGVQWSAGAIGHARWSGPALADVLRATELKSGAKHVWFEGLDPIKEKDGSVAPFGGSIPLDKALAADAQTLLAHTMNDAPLTAAHGFPLRTVVPGYIGARSVKWLTKIVVSDRPSPNHYVAEAYKLVQSDDKAEAAAAEPIYAFPVNVAICSPGENEKRQAGRNIVTGYALPAGEPGCAIAKVELSTDGGKSWSPAKLAGEARAYAWQLWTAEVELTPGRRDLIVRATDTRGNATPREPAWNAKGYLHNAWHRVAVEVV